MIINAGITKICYHSGYADAMSKEMLEEAGIDIKKTDTT
jgi:dCMP deaminase